MAKPANLQHQALSWRGKCLVTLGSVLIALCIAELGARLLHHRAFPYLNIFVSDSRYGVRLAPSTSTRVRSRFGRITQIETNSLGFRGPEWRTDSASRTRVLIIGDSQVLGYGIPYADTIGAKLESKLGGTARVFAAAVPSWGPSEYVRALSDLQASVHPQFVIFVANAANDWFELSLTNARRTTALDGWAARYSTKGDEARPFPGREFLMARSHLVLAIRQLAGYIGGAEISPAEGAHILQRDLTQLREAVDGHRSRMTPAFLQAANLCKSPDCTLVAAALPVDVQVDSREWAKYREKPIDLSSTDVLLEDFVADAKDAGLPAINLTSPLRSAEPGAFLADDYHLSPRGAACVADALANTLRAARALAQGEKL